MSMQSPAVRKSFTAVVAAFSVCIAILICSISLLDLNKLHAARLENKSFVRQMNSAFHLADVNSGIVLFSQWNTSPEIEQFKKGPIHLSYSSVSNVFNTATAKITKNKTAYSNVNLGIGCVHIAICATILFCTILFKIPAKNNHIRSEFLAVIATLLFVTNPANLMMLVEPDFEDCFIFMLFLGCMFLHLGTDKLSKITFFLSSLLYPLGGAALVGSFGLSKISGLISKKIINTRDFVGALGDNKYLPLATGISVFPILWGFLSYWFVRLMYLTFNSSANYQNYSGGSLITRAALDPNDQFYGGVLGLFRFLIPISGLPASVTQIIRNRTLELSDMWTIINFLQLAFFFFLISLVAFIFALLTNFRGGKIARINHYIIPNLFFMLTCSVLLFLPQWSSVHFRLVSRFFAPAMSFYLGYLLCSLGSRFKPIIPFAFTFVAILACLISLDQIHFFAKWMIFTS